MNWLQIWYGGFEFQRAASHFPSGAPVEAPLRRIERTPQGYELHRSLPMTYDSSGQALNELGRDARFEDDIGIIATGAANEVNRMSSKEPSSCI